MPRQRKILVLQRDVKNPKPDGRARDSVWAEKMWPKDSLWCLTTTSNCAGEKLEHLDALTRYGVMGDITRFGCKGQWDVLAGNGLEPCFTPYEFDPNRNDKREFTALLMLYRFDADMLLKYLFASGKVHRQVLCDAQAAIDEMEDSEEVWRVE